MNMRKKVWPTFIIRNAIKNGNAGSVKFGDNWIPFGVLKRETSENYYFAGYLTNENGRTYLFVSEDVPKHFREPLLHHIAKTIKSENMQANQGPLFLKEEGFQP